MIRFILADLRRLWAGAFTVSLLVALAVGLGVGVTLVERGLRLGSARAAAKFDLVVGAPGSATQLVLSSVFLDPAPLPLVPGAVLARLAADPRVAWASPVGFGDSVGGSPVVGVTPTLIAETARGFAAGRTFAAEGEAVAGAAAPVALGETLTPTHGLAGAGGHRHTDVAYTVVGRLAPTGTAWDTAILVPIQAVWHVHGLGGHHDEHEEHDDHDAHAPHGGFDADAPLDADWDEAPGVPAILVKPKSVADAYTLRRDYRDGGTLAVFPAEVLTALYATLGDARAVLAAIAAGAQALVAAALVLVAVVHVGQRRRQIGALRAFGAPRGAVFALVWGELMALVVVGLALGHALGYAAARGLAARFAAERGVSLPVAFAPADAAVALALLAAAAAFAAIPAWRAFRAPPVEALRD
ncbi:conserved membrane hypothetical protein [uncultured Alphaproteobacteria bacterium]|uniref:ABC3 transporter permease C-terminal domain-containing protein n=1 Tax=uncultured Alphaproteobacteria bacterium TaxID=91750 RepID=A0A212KLR1_9PROT|nr:conserved membrane hypothetical protein [uncultured Alphaproteobacteria bacterium]